MRSRLKTRYGVAVSFVLTGFLGTPVYGADVLSIGDGDTITVRKQGGKVMIRLACIDAPETSQRPYGLQSREALRALLPIGSSVILRVKAKDRYGRTVAELLNSRGNINQRMVGSGQAFVYRKHLEKCDARQYLSLELQA